MRKLTFKGAVTHPKDIDLTRIVCIYNHHSQYLNVSVWNTEKREAKPPCSMMLHAGIWNIPMKSCTYPWPLRLPPMQFTGVFAQNVVMVQYAAASFVGHVVLSGSHAGLSWDCSLCLAMLLVIYLFWCAQRLIEQAMHRIQRCQLLSLASAFCESSFCNDWYMDINLIHAFHDKTVFLKRCNASKAHWSHACCLHLQSSQSVNVSVWNTEKRDTKQNH